VILPPCVSRPSVGPFRVAALCACLTLASLGFAASCGLPSSRVALSVSGSGPSSHLTALSSAAKTGVLTDKEPSAWFSLGAHAASLIAGAPPSPSIELTLELEKGSVASVSVAPVFAEDLNASGRLVSDPKPRALSVVRAPGGAFRVRFHADSFAGFAVSLEGSAPGTRLRVLSASLAPFETGWSFRSSEPWFGFGDSGGERAFAVPQNPAGIAYAVELAGGSSALFGFDPRLADPGTATAQNKSRFSAGSFSFGWRQSPSLTATWLPSFMMGVAPGEAPVQLVPLSGTAALRELRVVRGLAYPCADPSNPRSPIVADPHAAVEWPVASWRNADYEIFSWDRFPSVLLFDTADYAVQDRLFKRLAFFVEKTGYRGRLITDAEMRGLHAYNAHDYRAESLAEFFEAARLSGFPLGTEELELRAILLAEGIIALRDSSYVPGAGAVVSISRQSAAYLRYLFLAHESYHGIYFTDPGFRAEVADVFAATDKRAVDYLKDYFTVVDTLGYDVSDPYLLENEYMAYLLQQPQARVAPYFTDNVDERFLRYGGDPGLSDYVRATDAADFAAAAERLGAYAFSRWGLTGGRVGLWYFDD